MMEYSLNLLFSSSSIHLILCIQESKKSTKRFAGLGSRSATIPRRSSSLYLGNELQQSVKYRSGAISFTEIVSNTSLDDQFAYSRSYPIITIPEQHC